MREAVQNFLRLEVQNMIDPIYWAVVLAWLGLLITSLSSIWGRTLHTSLKVLWSAIVLFVPLVGLYIYLFYCLFTADRSAFERFGFFTRKLQD